MNLRLVCHKTKLFDKLVQKAKRRHWYDIQTEMLANQKKDQKQFWNDLVKLELEIERSKYRSQSEIVNDNCFISQTLMTS